MGLGLVVEVNLLLFHVAIGPTVASLAGPPTCLHGSGYPGAIQV